MADLTKKKAEALFTGAMSMFGNQIGAKPPLQAPTAPIEKGSKGPVLENNPEDIPKEDLLHLCMKLNKRMQSMETKGQELTKQKTVLLGERRQLLDAIKQRVAIPTSPGDDQELDTGVIIELMNKSDEHNKALISSLEKKASDLEQSKMHEALEIDAKHRKEIQDLKRALSLTSAVSNISSPADPSVSGVASPALATADGNISLPGSTTASVRNSINSQDTHPLQTSALMTAEAGDSLLLENERLIKEKNVSKN